MTKPAALPESTVQAEARKAVGKLPWVRFWRNNSGLLFDRVGNPVRFGVASPGGSDLIGLTQVVITPAMVGRTLAVFTAAEVKTAKGKPTDAQLRFIEFVNGFGGIAGIVRSNDDIVALVSRERPP